MDSIVSVGALVGMAYFLSGYHKESVIDPYVSLPLQSTPDVRRWRHDGQQPKSERVGNLQPSIHWQEVDVLLS